MFINLFTKNLECTHEQITPDIDFGYCPDCGEYVHNQWFITRCACCGIKQKTIALKTRILAEAKFCRNCGNNSFLAEKLFKINLVDINYAVLVKKSVKNVAKNFVQTWIEREIEQIKLIPQKYI